MTDQPTVNLNITDISDAVKVMDHASEQGAFRGWENIRQILALRDRLDAFVQAANAVVTSPSNGDAADVTSPPNGDAVDEIPVSPPRHQRRSRAGSFATN